jgi:hypothetical protein
MQEISEKTDLKACIPFNVCIERVGVAADMEGLPLPTWSHRWRKTSTILEGSQKMGGALPDLLVKCSAEIAFAARNLGPRGW